MNLKDYRKNSVVITIDDLERTSFREINEYVLSTLPPRSRLLGFDKTDMSGFSGNITFFFEYDSEYLLERVQGSLYSGDCVGADYDFSSKDNEE